jgi:chromosome segregation ATPase
LAKIAISIPNSILSRIDQISRAQGIARSKYAAMALDFYSNGAIDYKSDIDKLNIQLSEKAKELETLSNEVLPLREMIYALENTLEEKEKKIDSLSNEIAWLKDGNMGSRENFDNMQREKEKLEVALNAKDGEVDFLRSHVVQLTQSINQLAQPQITVKASRTKETLLSDLESRNCIGSKCY